MITTLQQLSDEHHRRECAKTSMRPDYVPKFKYTERTANGLTRAVIDFLTFHNCQAERVSTEGRVIDGRKKVSNHMGQVGMIGSVSRIPTSGKKGSADIAATIRGLSVKLEIKVGNDRQSPAQKAYQEEVERAGGQYWIVRSFNEMVEKFNSFL